MNSLRIEESVIRFLANLERKHAGQIALKILSLINDPQPADMKVLQGTKTALYRVDVGEFRIIFAQHAGETQVILVGRRNDDDVYKELKRKGL